MQSPPFPHKAPTPTPTLIPKPTRITSAGNKPKLIDEYIGRVNSNHSGISIAHMRSPGGWVEPGQTPEFEEYTVVLKGTLRVEHNDGALDVSADNWKLPSTFIQAGALRFRMVNKSAETVSFGITDDVTKCRGSLDNGVLRYKVIAFAGDQKRKDTPLSPPVQDAPLLPGACRA